MKILCLSDTHIGAGYDHRADALADTDEMFDQVLALIEERQVDLCVHAGDVYHRSKPSPGELLCFKRFCDGLAELDVPLVIIEGNGAHTSAPGQPSAIELFRSSLVHVSRIPQRIPFAGVTVCTLPAASLSRLVASQDGGDRAKLQEQAVELLLRSARDLFAEADPSKPRILLAHQMVSGASLPTGLPVEQVGSVVLPLEELERIGFDAIVLGDIHRHQELQEKGRPPVFYCGSPMIQDFGEQNDEHGVYVVEIGNTVYPVGSYRIELFSRYAEFVPLSDRRFVTVDVALASLGQEMFDVRGLDETDQIATKIAERFPLTDAVVRVRYRATDEQHRRVDQPAILRRLADAGIHKLYGGLQWEPVREQRTRAEGLDESLSPLAALELWLEAEQIQGPPRDSLRELLAGWETA